MGLIDDNFGDLLINRIALHEFKYFITFNRIFPKNNAIELCLKLKESFIRDLQYGVVNKARRACRTRKAWQTQYTRQRRDLVVSIRNVIFPIQQRLIQFITTRRLCERFIADALCAHLYYNLVLPCACACDSYTKCIKPHRALQLVLYTYTRCVCYTMYSIVV